MFCVVPATQFSPPLGVMSTTLVVWVMVKLVLETSVLSGSEASVTRTRPWVVPVLGTCQA